MDINKENLKTTTAPSVIWRLPLTPIEKILLFNLAYLERDGKVTNKTQTLLAYIAGTTTPSVKRCMANMEKNGWITRTKMFAQSDIYTINWEMIIKETKESDIMGTIQKNIKQKEDGTFEKIDEENANTTYLSPSNSKDEKMYYQEVEESTEPLKKAIEEEIEVVNNNTDNDMGTFIGDFKELSNKTTAQTTQNVVEDKYDGFSNELKRLLNEYKGVIDQLTTMIAKANMSDDVCVVSTAKMAEMRIKNISKQLVAEIDKTNYRGYIDEKIETKTKKLQVA